MDNLVPIVQILDTVANGISDFVVRTRELGYLDEAQYQAVKIQISSALRSLRVEKEGAVANEKIAAIANAQARIDYLQEQGQLYGSSLNMAMDILEGLNNRLRSI